MQYYEYPDRCQYPCGWLWNCTYLLTKWLHTFFKMNTRHTFQIMSIEKCKVDGCPTCKCAQVTVILLSFPPVTHNTWANQLLFLAPVILPALWWNTCHIHYTPGQQPDDNRTTEINTDQFTHWKDWTSDWRSNEVPCFSRGIGELNPPAHKRGCSLAPQLNGSSASMLMLTNLHSHSACFTAAPGCHCRATAVNHIMCLDTDVTNMEEILDASSLWEVRHAWNFECMVSLPCKQLDYC